MGGAAADGQVTLVLDGPVAHVTFDRPAASNAMTWQMYEQLAEACRTLAASDTVRVAVLRGAGGKAFIAGTAIDQFRCFTSGEDGIASANTVDAYVGQLQDRPKPTYAL